MGRCFVGFAGKGCLRKAVAFIFIFITGVLLFCRPVVAKSSEGPVSESSGPPSIQEKALFSPKALQRKYDNTVVTGAFLPSMLGKEISLMRLYAASGGSLHPIAFQIDERDADGLFVCPQGPQAGEDEDKGRFDNNDEIIFIAGDAGDKVTGAPLPEGCRASHEIVITDPQDPAKKAWAYLLYFSENPPPLSKEDYLTYDPEIDRVIGKYYTVGYNKGFMLFTDLIYPEQFGGNGKDMLDRIKLRVDVHLLGGLIHIKKSEDDIRCKVIGWKDGPIRVIRNTENYLRLLFNIPSPSMLATTEYYPHYFTVPMRFNIPFNLKYVMNTFVVKGFHVLLILDFHSEMTGMRAYTPNNPQGILATGNTTEKELAKKYNLNSISWSLFKKEEHGAFFVRLSFPEAFLQLFNIYVKDDRTFRNPPEDEVGEMGGGMRVYSKSLEKKYGREGGRAFTADIWNMVQAGTVELCIDTYIAHPSTTLDGTDEWIAIRDFPLEIDVTGEEKGSDFVLGETNSELIKAVVIDRKGRQISLRDIVFHLGSQAASPWPNVLGYEIETRKWHSIPIKEMKQMDFRIEDVEPESGLTRPLFIKVTKKDGSIIDLFNAKPAGFAGRINDSEKFFIWNPLIERIELRD